MQSPLPARSAAPSKCSYRDWPRVGLGEIGTVICCHPPKALRPRTSATRSRGPDGTSGGPDGTSVLFVLYCVDGPSYARFAWLPCQGNRYWRCVQKIVGAGNGRGRVSACPDKPDQERPGPCTAGWLGRSSSAR